MKNPLTKHREAHGITKAWMAKQLGVHHKTYANYENGTTQPPRSVLFHAAHLLHVSPEELIHEAE